tara:strand:+ start:45467 stop:46558 length:1092 start_codon:yes stop_codon:yes gene_type:complete
MIYIYQILSRINSERRLSFYLPWLGIFIGTIFFLLVDTVMSGMENEIFSKLKKIDSGAKIYPNTNTDSITIEKFLKKNNITYKECINRDVIIGNSINQSMAKLILCDETFKDDYFKIGSTMSSKLNIWKEDTLTLYSPLDVQLSTLLFPIEEISVSSIFNVPVLDFDNIYIFSNNQKLISKIKGDIFFIIEDNISIKEYICDSFPEIKISNYLDDYSSLVNAIHLETNMYRTFSFLLILISSLGLFTTLNYSIVNKRNSFISLNNIGIKFSFIRRNAYLLLTTLAASSTILGIIFTYLTIKLGLWDPLIAELFPKEIFYKFNLIISFNNALLILLINVFVVLFSIIIPLNAIHYSLKSQTDYS